eukprot:5445491-Pyramimonas_sp.AAC.1
MCGASACGLRRAGTVTGVPYGATKPVRGHETCDGCAEAQTCGMQKQGWKEEGEEERTRTRSVASSRRRHNSTGRLGSKKRTSRI